MPTPRILLGRTHLGAIGFHPTEVFHAHDNIGGYDEDALLAAVAKEERNDPRANPERFLIEGDPNGISQHTKGAKLDSGKPDAGLVLESFPNALMAVAEVATFGANKYTRGGWKEVPGGLLRYKAAEMRHKLYREMGEEYDKESGFLHRAHEAWNALAQLEYVLTGREAQ